MVDRRYAPSSPSTMSLRWWPLGASIRPSNSSAMDRLCEEPNPFPKRVKGAAPYLVPIACVGTVSGPTSSGILGVGRLAPSSLRPGSTAAAKDGHGEHKALASRSLGPRSFASRRRTQKQRTAPGPVGHQFRERLSFGAPSAHMF